MTQMQPEARSEPMSARSRMELIGERHVPDPPNPTMMPPPPSSPRPNLQKEYIERSAWRAGFIGAMNAVGLVLAARLTLLVAVSGGISLAWIGLADPNPLKLGILAIYACAVVIPVVWLCSR